MRHPIKKIKAAVTAVFFCFFRVSVQSRKNEVDITDLSAIFRCQVG